MLPISRVIGHREWAPARKSDPTFDCDWMRAGVAGIRPIPAGQPAPPPLLDEDLMLRIPIRYGTQPDPQNHSPVRELIECDGFARHLPWPATGQWGD